jgi:RNA polymerase sigma-B factor
VATTTTTPPRWTQSRTRDTDDQIEVLAAQLSTTTDTHRRSELVDDICRLALPLADGIAARYRGRGIELEDLEQVARTALVKAVLRYRPGAGCGFAAYACPTISGEVKRWFRDHGWAVRPPRRLQELRAQIATTQEKLRHQLGREPTSAELADTLTVSQSEVEQAKVCSAAYHATSLDAPTTAGTTVGEHLLATSSSPFTTIDSLDALHRAFADLTDRQRHVLRLRFVEDLTQSEIGELIGVSQMQVSRILATTLTTLRTRLSHDTNPTEHAA